VVPRLRDGGGEPRPRAARRRAPVLLDDAARAARAHAAAAHRRRAPAASLRQGRRGLARHAARREGAGGGRPDDRRPVEGPGLRPGGAPQRDHGRGGQPGPLHVHAREPLRRGGTAMTGRSSWRRQLPALAGALVFAAANLVFFVVYGSGADTRRAALESRRESLAKTVAAAEKEANRLTAQKERLSGVSEAMEEFYGRRIGTQRETLAGVVEDLHAA